VQEPAEPGDERQEATIETARGERGRMRKATIVGRTLELARGDVTREMVDAIVTAANAGLHGGGGVDGAVHAAAGRELLAACRRIGGCPIGDAVATPAFDIRQAKRVIHAVGPVFGAAPGRDDELLASAHRRALEVAAGEGCKSIAFPAISCGVYGFPIERAARVALSSIVTFLGKHDEISHVRYVLFAERELQVFEEALDEVAASNPSLVIPG
jgi:O-acetyl-ADP-ribose deacetylase (regulator of RNase III)